MLGMICVCILHHAGLGTTFVSLNESRIQLCPRYVPSQPPKIPAAASAAKRLPVDQAAAAAVSAAAGAAGPLINESDSSASRSDTQTLCENNGIFMTQKWAQYIVVAESADSRVIYDIFARNLQGI